MSFDSENAANQFLELSSQQRLNIMLKLAEKKYKVSVIAKELNATVPEVFRNFERLAKAELIYKDSDGNYHLTTYGKTVCSCIPSITFLSQNKKYFKDHDFGDIPQKFIQRMGALVSGQYVKGFVKVQEYWKDIYKNANEYIFNILYEVSYSSDLVESLVEKLKNNVKVNSIFSEAAIIPKERRKILDKIDFKKFIEKGTLEKRMKKDVKVVIILNEKEAGIIFPTVDGDVEMNAMFYSNHPLFHEWCRDYFNYYWQNSGTFQESKLKE